MCPCKDCEERSVTCHIKCERYLAFAKECKLINKSLKGTYTGVSKRRRKSLWTTHFRRR